MSKDTYKRFEKELTKTFYHIWILMNISVIYGQIFYSDFLTDYLRRLHSVLCSLILRLCMTVRQAKPLIGQKCLSEVADGFYAHCKTSCRCTGPICAGIYGLAVAESKFKSAINWAEEDSDFPEWLSNKVADSEHAIVHSSPNGSRKSFELRRTDTHKNSVPFVVWCAIKEGLYCFVRRVPFSKKRRNS